MFVDGSALGLGADLTLGRDSVWAVTTTTLEDDVRVVSTVTPEPTPESTPYAHLGQDIGMVSPTSGAHALTVENYFGSIVHHGSLTGADAACSLTKKGPGTFVLGGPGGKGSPWSGTNTWAGPTDVQAGTLGIDAPGALSSHTDVHIEGGARVAATFPDAGGHRRVVQRLHGVGAHRRRVRRSDHDGGVHRVLRHRGRRRAARR